MSGKILVVEDDAVAGPYICHGLKEAGYSVDYAADGREALYLATSGQHDLIVLDRMLPSLDGLSVLQALRAAMIDVPVIILSALNTLDERVKGLRAGSDDYLVKPFAFTELLARIEVLMRRPRAGMRSATVTELRAADLAMDLLSRKVSRGGREIELQPREFRLLEFLLRHQGQVVTRTMLLEGVWDYYFDPNTNVIDVHISRLRQKIDKDHAEPLIHTVRGAGYMLAAEK